MSAAQPLIDAVRTLAAATHHLSETTLGSEVWAWGDYVEVRYAFLGSYLELRDLAARILDARIANQPPTEAQRALAQHQAAFRDIEALLVGLPAVAVTTPPAEGEWPVNVILTHIHTVERFFLGTILNALRNPTPVRLRLHEAATLLGEPQVLDDQQPLSALWADFERLHSRVISELAPLNDADLAVVAPMWEPSPIPVRFRMHRFDAHLREHANQLEKTLRAIHCAPNEAKLLIRQLYGALAEVEGALMGTPDMAADDCAALAEILGERTASVLRAVEESGRMVAAAQLGDLPTIEQLLVANPRLANARSEAGVSAILLANYHGHAAVAQRLAAAKGELTIFEAAALGNLDELKANLDYVPESLNGYAADGFTPLQLAAYFGHEATVRHLLTAGADLHAVSKNAMRIQPIHAAVAQNSLPIVEALLQAGADPNAKQQDEYTPLMAARQHENGAMVALLRRYGAVG